MNEDIDFYNKASRSEGSSDANEDEHSPQRAAQASKEGGVDPDLVDDPGQFNAA